MALAGSFALPEPAEARGSSRRRNYADEMRQDQLEDERREERRREDREYQAKQQQRWLEHDARRQERYLDHSGKPLDKWLGNTPAPAAPARKLSGTCMYGANDKVVYQPKGVVCEKR